MKTIEAEAEGRLRARKEALRRLATNNARDEQEALEDQPADWTDRASERSGAVVLRRLTESELGELAEIEAALERLRGGIYGRCEQCGGAIGRQRLRAIPEAKFCVVCREQAEHAA